MSKEFLLFLDCETGGLDPEVHAIASVAVYCPELGIEAEALISDTQGGWTDEASAVNGLDRKRCVYEGVSCSVAARALTSIAEKAMVDARLAGGQVRLAGHNVGFDIGFIRRLYRLSKLDVPKLFNHHRNVDTHSLLWALADAGHAPNSATSSQGAFDHFGIERGSPHTAMGDCKATHQLMGCIREWMG